ncbi:MAG TPA: gamma-glutamyl-gamma-aminobutyrate hydrolase family protein [Patescibacteria group bacterium]|nr:gamma-glutamyl-gamma-aminobutyrate hydrolase family protein [Patescibacteria group bacterium]
MKIAISKGSGSEKYENYGKWIKKADETVECVDMSRLDKDEALKTLEECSGIVLTGGEDIDPSRYGAKVDFKEKHVETDSKRDELEFALVEKAEQLKMPILGICRGAQLLNVAFGGTLVVDIPSEYETEQEHRAIEKKDQKHEVEIVSGSILKKIARTDECEVNSAHHQAITRLPQNLSAAAKAPDGIIEAFEWQDPMGKPFLLAVQWHPERMENPESPLSLPIARHFLFEAESYQLLQKNNAREEW